MDTHYQMDRRKFESLMKQRGYSSISAFAKACDLHRNTLNGYLLGNQSVFSKAFSRIAARLQVDPWHLTEAVHLKSHEIPADLQKTLAVLTEKYPTAGFLLMGSRVRGTQKTFSDWDIGITAGIEKLSSGTFLRIKSLLQDLLADWIYKVDLINLDQAPHWFLIEIDYDPVFLTGNREAWHYFKGRLDEIQKTTEIKRVS